MIVNKRQLADIMGCTEETLSQWTKQGMPVLLQRLGKAGNQYETAAVISWREARNQSDSPPTDYETERTRKVKIEADILAFEKAKLEGKLIPAETVELAWTRMAVEFRAKMLSIPTKCAPLVSGLSFIEVETVLTDAINDALSALANNDLADSIANQFEDCDARSETATEADRQPVG